MILVILFTILLVAIPMLYIFNSKYVEKLALFIGISQIAFLAFSGKIDTQISDFLVIATDKVVSFSFNIIIQKVCLLLYNI